MIGKIPWVINVDWSHQTLAFFKRINNSRSVLSISKTFQFILVLLVLMACHSNPRSEEKEDQNLNQKEPISSSLSSKDNLQLDHLGYYPIEQDTSRFHYFGDTILERAKGGFYESKWINNKYIYAEVYPEIVVRHYKKRWQNGEVYYLDELRQRVLKEIEFKTLNPFLSRYDSVLVGYPKPDYYGVLTEAEIEIYKHRTPTSYISYFSGTNVMKNGYISLVFHCVGRIPEGMLNWESAIVILNRLGSVEYTLYRNDAIRTAFVSDSGKLLIYRIGGLTNNPYSAAQGHYEIVDLTSNRQIMKIIPEEGYEVAGISQDADGFLRLHYLQRKKGEAIKMIDLFHLDHRIRMKGQAPHVLLHELINEGVYGRNQPFLFPLKDEFNLIESNF